MLRMVTKMSDLSRIMERIIQILDDCVVEEFTEWAKRDDAYLRNNDGFIDRTGNLRSSLGAAVIKEGKVAFMTSFRQVLNGAEGSQEGRRAIERIASSYQKSIAKVMVAGMDYAQRVEDIESKDVLESRRIQCEREAKDIIDRAMRKAERCIKEQL